MKPQIFSDSELKDMISRRVGSDRVPRAIRLITDTSDFFRVDYDDVVMLGDRPRGISKKEEFIYGSTSNKILHSQKNCTALWVVE